VQRLLLGLLLRILLDILGAVIRLLADAEAGPL